MSGGIVLNWLASTPDFAVPYALAALGLIICERAGVLALGAEGLMLVGALAGIGAQIVIGQPAVSLVLAMLAASVVSVLFAVMVIWLRVNQVIAGLALVFFCQGLTALVGSMAEWTNHATEGIGTMGLWPLSLLPVVGRLFEQNAMVWLTLPIFGAVAWFFARTSAGLRLRAVGENPQAADAAGIRVTAWRFAAVLAGSALVGLAGAYISVVSTKLWIAGMTGGRGWIAVGLVIFARWSPWKALVGALLFGCIEALIPQLAAAGVQLPQYFVMMTPYAVTLGVMVWVALSRRGADEEPGALGQPYVREERR
ncbi:ABC transporter permease [Variovorax sp. NFACC27]|uniref:ABC transporter permease n=1 Tax=Variovorax gossypii TaxID=1679495 RepID=A0A431TD62_9BURK|nr:MULTISPECIES: ABC transporter permease [Variovorax]SEF33046.1 simple sugar transport system permease protein [Variovorax sp. NFACC28]SEG95654.1 simple sugar transport system permease protein [Variovorax sp. NFACC29]SFD78583.1 simple sugar transport system permease protein [Variovorax sp. NFACC26]SFG92600.1 simple sugar transport system permease protein [Variovorax sp. NFACC27]RTQ30877.1 ABC transporter permease [Variovorax gossypii]